ncbi:avidin/streptavidin family protein [Streptomyces meridianus]|uniref:Streptavidin n=1 Tax=Streptomyces meridianus TaxID=2938945 RepID=A0ABT0X3V7_9ACTN|nr:avidin/streptavidin family protein [Streptomyces meridianus]MCM2577226.1 avidin/streptavidin family protein [Streptomyces meridianus]
MTITGDWYNELGSYMQFTADPFGGITGTYVSAKGHATGRYTLVGRYDTPSEEGYGTPIGWTVAWSNEQHDAGSVTCWNGLYTSEGGEQICATWLLTGSAPLDDVWESTAVGQDIFTREAPGADRIEEATAARAAETVSAKHMGRRKPRAAAGRVRKGEGTPA